MSRYNHAAFSIAKPGFRSKDPVALILIMLANHHNKLSVDLPSHCEIAVSSISCQ
jgi:hypothetical protein